LLNPASRLTLVNVNRLSWPEC